MAFLPRGTAPALPRVEALNINRNCGDYQALSDLEVPVESVAYPREGHGVVETAHRRDFDGAQCAVVHEMAGPCAVGMLR